MFGLLAQTPDGDPLCAEYGELGFAVYPLRGITAGIYASRMQIRLLR